MGDYRDLLERERRKHAMRGGTMADLEKRRDRRHRNRRIASGLVALVIAAAGIGAGLFALRPTGSGKPSHTPTPTPTPNQTPTPTPSQTPSFIPMGLPGPSGPVQFVDEQFGWAVGPNGEILATTDGGKTWDGQYSGPLKIFGVQFVDDHHGWAVGENGGLLRTLDGGGSWDSVTGEAFSSVDFVTPSTGWAIRSESRGVVKTTDGGSSWMGQGISADSVCGLDEEVAWAAGPGEGGISFLKTADGGKSWDDHPIAVAQGEPWSATVRCAGIDAWVLVTDGGAAGHLPYALFHTAEGGPDAIPVLQEAGTRPLGNVKGVIDAQDPSPGPFVAFNGVDALFVGWCPPCGNSVALYGSITGWSRQELVNQGATPLGISFSDAQHGWITLLEDGSKGPAWTVLATTDGGRTWSVVSGGASP